MEREKRVDPRYTARFDVRFSRSSDASRALNAFSVNFSAGGICVRSKNHYGVGELLSLEVTIEDDRFELTGTVAWARGDVLGIRFVNVNPMVRDRLRRVAEQLSGSSDPFNEEPEP